MHALASPVLIRRARRRVAIRRAYDDAARHPRVNVTRIDVRPGRRKHARHAGVDIHARNVRRSAGRAVEEDVVPNGAECERCGAAGHDVQRRRIESDVRSGVDRSARWRH